MSSRGAVLSTQRIVIFGGLGAGAIAAQSIAALASAGAALELAGFLNDAMPRGERICGAPVLGTFADWRGLDRDVGFLAPLHKAKAMPSRRHLVEALGVPPQRWRSVVDPRSAVAADAVIGEGCFIGPFATVAPGASLGRHSVVRAGAHVSHDCAVGDFVFIGSNAVVSGWATLRDGAYVAPSAAIRDRCQVGRFAVVGLGAVVVRDVPDFAVVAGSPARQIGTVAALEGS
jgi:sugar O-acyltransferase (sialic acid O-acetyltransferase NeuD family)